MLSGSWGSLRAVSSRYGTLIGNDFYSTLSQKGSSLQEKILSVCLFVCPSSLFLSRNIFLFFLLLCFSPPLTNFEVWHLERFNMVNNFYSTLPQKGSNLQEKILSICLFVCPSSLLPSPNFLFFLLRWFSPPLTRFEEKHLERSHMVNDL